MARTSSISLTLLALCSILFSGCGTNNSGTNTLPTASPISSSKQPSPSRESPVASEPPVAPEKNPPGDIPDTQVFVTYSSPPGGYQLKVPEGWARRTHEKNVSFIDKLDGVEVTLRNATAAPTAA
ncbi:MAG: hypothetical protein ACRDEA_02975, partial [Microcystaceae cyanobacterium]